MKKTGMIALLLLSTACAREGIQTAPEFADWSYRTRDREHNRYDGYDAYSTKAEQWQTDPYWTQGEGLERRKAAGWVQGGSVPQKQPMPMPPERFIRK